MPIYSICLFYRPILILHGYCIPKLLPLPASGWSLAYTDALVAERAILTPLFFFHQLIGLFSRTILILLGLLILYMFIPILYAYSIGLFVFSRVIHILYAYSIGLFVFSRLFLFYMPIL